MRVWSKVIKKDSRQIYRLGLESELQISTCHKQGLDRQKQK